MIGKTLAHYLVIQHLGSGGMGEVYLARDTKLDRNVALKVLPQDVADDPERMRRFAQEAKAASALDHPNVVHIYEIGESDGVRFIAMQYVEGEPLSNLIRERPLPLPQILDTAISVAEALQEAHAKGIVHRDIKPANILITTRGQAKVVDFGLAKVFRGPQGVDSKYDTATSSGMILGTVHYMSPEQALGKPVDHRSDLFSFGAVLYHMASARFPFEGQNSIEMLSNLLKSEPQPISQHNPDLPAEIGTIIQRCLQKDPEKRYQSAQDLAQDLRNIKHDTAPLSFSTLRMKTARFSRFPILAVLILAVAAIAGFYLVTQETGPIDSIAVLPFSNTNRSSNIEFLSDGITDSVITSLSQLPQLRVMARSTVFSYKGKQVDPRNVGKELHVRAVLTGELVQMGDDLTIRAELVDARDGALLWNDQYSRNINNLLGVQEDISRDISQSLRLKLTGEQQQRLGKHYTDNAHAYELYLKGRYYWNKRTEEGFRKAIELFQAAIEKDPNYALAYAGLADCYTLMPAWALLPPAEGHSKAKMAALKAISLDDSLAEAHKALAHTLHNFDWDWNGAGQQYRRAIELNPGYSTSHHWYAWDLIQDGHSQEGIREIQRALELDPFSLIINADYGYLLLVVGQQEKAIDQLNKTLELDPRFSLAYEYFGYAFEIQKQYPKELSAFKKAAEYNPESAEIRAEVARAQALCGNVTEAQRTLADLTHASSERYVVAFDVAMIYDALGQKDMTFEWLKKACDEHSYQISGLAVDPRLQSLRSDPRFAELLDRVHPPGEPGSK